MGGPAEANTGSIDKAAPREMAVSLSDSTVPWTGLEGGWLIPDIALGSCGRAACPPVHTGHLEGLPPFL